MKSYLNEFCRCCQTQFYEDWSRPTETAPAEFISSNRDEEFETVCKACAMCLVSAPEYCKWKRTNDISVSIYRNEAYLYERETEKLLTVFNIRN